VGLRVAEMMEGTRDAFSTVNGRHAGLNAFDLREIGRPRSFLPPTKPHHELKLSNS
jgi:hypothetical protein